MQQLTPHHTAYPPLIIQHTHPSSYSIPSPHCIEHHPVDKPLPSERKPYYTGYSPLWLRAQGRPNFWYYNVIYKCTRLHSQLFWDACDPWAAGWAHLLECVYAVTLTTVLFFLWLKFALKKNLTWTESRHPRLGWEVERKIMPASNTKISAQYFFPLSFMWHVLSWNLYRNQRSREERKRKKLW